MLAQLMEMFKEVEENDEFFKTIASAMKKMFDALVEKGFTEEQALAILVSQGFGFKTS